MSLRSNAPTFVPLREVPLNYGSNPNATRNANWRKGRALAKKNRLHMQKAEETWKKEANAGNATANAMFAPGKARKTRKTRKARKARKARKV